MLDMLAGWLKAKRFAYLYRSLSDLEAGTLRQLLFLELAKEADDESARWTQKIQEAGKLLPVAYQPENWVKSIVWLAHLFGPRRIKLILSIMKLQGLSGYFIAPLGRQMPLDGEKVETGFSQSAVLRTAVLGIHDGLIAIALLVIVVAGAGKGSSTLLIIGVAGLIAGGFAMVITEYAALSALQKRIERHALGPDYDELIWIYQSRGMTENEASAFALRMMTDPEMGLDRWDGEDVIDEQSSSPWQIASVSWFAFITGGAMPLLPFAVGVQRHPLLISVILSGVLFLGTGVWVSLLARRQVLWGGLRMAGVASVTGWLAYFFGKLLGGAIG